MEEVKANLTCNYGFCEENTKIYNMKEISDKILNYKITKIKCQLKSDIGIYGIQIFCRNLIDGKETMIINVPPKEKDLIEQEFDLKDECIINMVVWLDPNPDKLNGFKVITNKDRAFKFGYGKDNELTKIPDLEQLDNIVVGFGVNVNDSNLITSIYAYYVNKQKYILNMYQGILFLRAKIKNQKYNEKIKKKLGNMKEKNQILYRICGLPQNQFFNVIKYTK